MGIYVKGMEMPKNCWECKFEKIFSSHADEIYCVCIIAGTHIDDGQEDWCPLVSVPDHGDLIDRDVLMKYKASAYDIDDHELYAVGTGTILRMPAVIPADKEEV